MSETRSTKQLFGLVLMTVGGLIAGLSGLCTLGFAGLGLISMLPGPTDNSYAPVVVIGAFAVGIVPILIGVGFFFLGSASSTVNKPLDPMVQFFGLVLMTVGGLLGATSGLCTVTMMGVGLMGALQERRAEALVPTLVPLLVGLPMMALGLAVFREGLKILRPGHRAPPFDKTVFDKPDGE